MIELLGLLALVVLGGAVLATAGFVVWLVKIVFKLAMIPVWLGVAALKGLGLVLLSILALLVVGPVVLALGVAVLVPLLILGAMVWAGVALVT